jgi:hypothetical protein
VVLLISVYSLFVGFSQETYIDEAVERAVIDEEENRRMQEALSSVVAQSSES